MPKFIIEITCRVPEYIQLVVDATDPEQAQRIAIRLAGDNVDAEGDIVKWTQDYECSGNNYVTGVWPGQEAYASESLPILAEFAGEELPQSDAPDSAAAATADAKHQHDCELQEIADGAFGDNPATRGAARDALRKDTQ